ncbi:MAG: hypothetical protein ACKN91_05450 [Candidatus Fonsibacter sp.]
MVVKRLKRPSKKEIESLFDRWNNSLKTCDPDKVIANYAKNSMLLPTLSNKPRLTFADKRNYFKSFLQNKPFGKINTRKIEIAYGMAFDTGIYTFTFAKTKKVVEVNLILFS